MHFRREKVHGRGNGRDLQSGATITLDWVRRLHMKIASGGPSERRQDLANDREAILANDRKAIASGGRGARPGAILEPILPQTACGACGASLEPPFRTCAICQRSKRAAYDIKRNRKRGYCAGVRTRLMPSKRRRKI